MEEKNMMDQLIDAYPEMFKNSRDVYINEGWFPVISSLCFQINNHIEWTNTTRKSAIEYNELLEKAINGDTQPMIDYFESKSLNSDRRLQFALEEGFRKVKDEVPQVYVAQIKEKFGELRFYYDGGDDEISGMVRMAEEWASKTCEMCGKPGTLRHGGWMKTLCDEHEVERQKRYEEQK